jgi:hypothetical protein
VIHIMYTSKIHAYHFSYMPIKWYLAKLSSPVEEVGLTLRSVQQGRCTKAKAISKDKNGYVIA